MKVPLVARFDPATSSLRSVPMRRALLPFAAAAVVAILLLVVVDETAAQADGGGLEHVTLIGDSVADAIPGDSSAVRIVSQGIDLDLEVDACRRLVDQSCPPNPPTTVQVIKKLGPAVGPTVVIAVGYNDFEDHYAGEIADTLDALAAADVKHVFWLTLRAAHHPYINMNDDINAAAAKHPEMTVIDWNVYSRSHLDWFQADGIHLVEAGSEAMAGLIHDKLVTAGIAVPPVQVSTATLPPARRSKPYRIRLNAASGRAPYTWSLAGRLPAGLHLQGAGTISGTPRPIDKRGVFTFTVRVKDAVGQTDSRKLLLRLR
jgi:lysophospholipase L1-like esterase